MEAASLCRQAKQLQHPDMDVEVSITMDGDMTVTMTPRREKTLAEAIRDVLREYGVE